MIGLGWRGEVTVNGDGVSSQGDKNVLNLDCGSSSWLSERTKNHRIKDFKWVNCIVYEL